MIELTKIRTIREAAKYLKTRDPNTAVTESFIRKLVNQRKIPVIKNGRTQMINIEILINYINEMSMGHIDMNDGNVAPVCEVLVKEDCECQALENEEKTIS